MIQLITAERSKTHSAWRRGRRSGRSFQPAAAEKPFRQQSPLFAFLGLTGAIILVPLFIGGRHPWGQAVLAICTFVAAAGTIIPRLRSQRIPVRLSGAEWILLSGMGILLIQLVPLTPELLAVLSPRLQEILPAWFGPDSHKAFGLWTNVSLVPAETFHSLLVFLCYGLLFLVVVNALETKDDIARLLTVIACGGIIAATIGFAQYATGTDRFLGVYEHPFRKASEYLTGSFSTKNHFAHYLVLTLGPLLFLLARPAEPAGRQHQPHTLGTSRMQPALRYGAAVGTGVVVLAIFGSLSRGGMVTAAVAVAMFVILLGTTRALRPRAVLAILLVCAVAGSSAYWLGGGKIRQRLATLTSGDLEALDHKAARRLIWSTTLRALPDFAPMGAGAGTFREVYPLYLPRYDFPRYFTHAESGYLQVALETGFPGLVLIFVAIATLGGWLYRTLRAKGDRQIPWAAAAAGAALAASVVHSFFDFVWYVPGCMAVTVILTGCLCRLAQLANQTGVDKLERRLHRPVAIGLLLAILVVTVGCVLWMSRLAMASAYWETYVHSVRRNQDRDQPPLSHAGQLFGVVDADASPEICGQMSSGFINAESASQVSPPSDLPDGRRGRAHLSLGDQRKLRWPRLTSEAPASNWHDFAHTHEQSRQSQFFDRDEGQQTGPRELREERLKAYIRLLTDSLAWFPWQPRVHLELAWRYLELFDIEQMRSEVPLPLSHIRDAAYRASFTCPEECRQWLRKVLGEREQYLAAAKRHAVEALRQCPLLGEAYLLLADLQFLEGSPETSGDLLVQQALRVRPHDGGVLFLVGQRAILAGDIEAGLQWWQEAARCGLVYQNRIVRLLAGRICPDSPAVELEVLLELFDFDLPPLQLLHAHYEPILGDEELRVLREKIAQRATLEAEASTPARAAALYLVAADMYQKLGQTADRLRAVQNAYREAPSEYRVRYYLAEAELAAGNYREAEKHFQWCAFRNPASETLRNKLKRIREQQLLGPRPGEG